MDQRRVLSRAIGQLAGERAIVCGNSMGGGLTMLQAAVEPNSVEGLVLTGSVFPAILRSLPNPLVVAAFGTYRVPLLGEAALEARFRRMSPEQMVRLGFAMCATRPGDIPPEVVLAHVEALRERTEDPEATRAFVEASRSMMRLGRRPEVAARALDGVRCPVLVLHGRRDRLVPARWAEEALAGHPSWTGHIFPDLGHIPQLEAPDRWLAEVADWHEETYT
jgi:pimeloyl-ACP methyl ester carboxylesterase